MISPVRGISNFNVTLYDLFGYLMPGVVALASLSLLAWSLFLPTHPLHEPSLSNVEWFAAFVLAYFLGHLVQAVAEVGFWPIRQEKVANAYVRNVIGDDKADELEALAKRPPSKLLEKLSFLARFHGKGKRIPFAYCDTYLAQNGKIVDREIYQYREDFYRGLMIALLPAVAAIVIELVRGNATVRNGGVHAIGSGPLVFALVIVVATVGLSFWRYRRFVEYRILDVVLGYEIDSQAAAKAARAES